MAAHCFLPFFSSATPFFLLHIQQSPLAKAGICGLLTSGGDIFWEIPSANNFLRCGLICWPEQAPVESVLKETLSIVSLFSSWTRRHYNVEEKRSELFSCTSTWVTAGMKEWSVNPPSCISKVSNKPAEKHYKPAPSRNSPSSVEPFVFCETDQLRKPLMGSDPAATVAGWEQARLHATGDFWDQWISPSISVWLGGSSFWSEYEFWPRSLFGSIYGRHVATAKSKPRHESSLCVHCPREPHQPKYLIQLWFIVMYWLLSELTALDILNRFA